MRRGLALLVPLLLVRLAQPLQAQTEQGTERRVPLRQCITQFYDPTMYNWLALKNDCTDVVIDVVFCGQVKGGCGGMTLAPRRHSNTGYSRREVTDKGEFAIYACPKGIYPYAMNGKQVGTGSAQPYQCGRPSSSSGASSGVPSTLTFPGSPSGSSSTSENLTLVTDVQVWRRDIKAKDDNTGRFVDRVFWKEAGGKLYCVQMPWNTTTPQTKCVLRDDTALYPFKRVRFR